MHDIRDAMPTVLVIPCAGVLYCRKMNMKGNTHTKDAETAGSGSGIFPHFTRFITAAPLKGSLRNVLHGLVWLVLIVAVAANVLSLRGDYAANSPTDVLGTDTSQPADTGLTQSALEGKYAFWQQTVKDHPDFRDGHYMLSLIAYQLNLLPEARAHLATVKRLDPNYEWIPQMEALLTKD